MIFKLTKEFILQQQLKIQSIRFKLAEAQLSPSQPMSKGGSLVPWLAFAMTSDASANGEKVENKVQEFLINNASHCNLLFNSPSSLSCVAAWNKNRYPFHFKQCAFCWSSSMFTHIAGSFHSSLAYRRNGRHREEDDKKDSWSHDGGFLQPVYPICRHTTKFVV